MGLRAAPTRHAWAPSSARALPTLGLGPRGAQVPAGLVGGGCRWQPGWLRCAQSRSVLRPIA